MDKYIDTVWSVDELITILNNYKGYDIQYLGKDENCPSIEIYADDILKIISLG